MISMPKQVTYGQSGVDRESRKEAKDFSIFEKGRKGAISTPYQQVMEDADAGNSYFALLADGVGTKQLLSQLSGKHNMIGIDGVAMVANDAARAGLSPRYLVDIIDINHSEKSLVAQLLSGISKGAKQAGCQVVGGETADVASLVNGIGSNPYNLNFSLYASCKKEDLIAGKGLKEGDKIIGLRSSGLHSNGFSLVRRLLFSQWGGAYSDPFAKVDGLDLPLIEECLKPTRIYAKEICEFQHKAHSLKAAVHITGDAYSKFDKLLQFNRGAGLSFDNFKPQPIYSVLKGAAGKLGLELTDLEMLKTFNMGWGFALALAKEDADAALGYFSKAGFEPEEIGTVTPKDGLIEAKFNSKAHVLS